MSASVRKERQRDRKERQTDDRFRQIDRETDRQEGRRDKKERQEGETDDEQRNYNWSLQEWEDYLSYQSMVQDLEESNVKEISQAFAALSIMIGIPAIAMFWTQNEKMLHFGIAFGTVKVVGDVLTAYISSGIVAKYMESVPGGGDYSWIAKTSVFSSACCGLLFIGLAVVLSNMYHSSKEIPDSGFHLKVNLISNSEE